MRPAGCRRGLVREGLLTLPKRRARGRPFDNAQDRPEHRRGAPSRRPGWLLPVAAAALACAAYLNALDNPFVYDNHDTVIANRSLADLSNIRVHSRLQPVPSARERLVRPRSLALGLSPARYRLTNIGIQAVVLLYSWIRRLLSDSGSARHANLAAFAGGAVFAIPLPRWSVVSGRLELCARSGSSARCSWREARSSREPGARRRRGRLRRAGDRIEGDRPRAAACFPLVRSAPASW